MNVSSSPALMSRRAYMPTCGSGEPVHLTMASSRLPPPQLWLKKRATLPFVVASMFRRRHALHDGNHSRTTCRIQITLTHKVPFTGGPARLYNVMLRELQKEIGIVMFTC